MSLSSLSSIFKSSKVSPPQPSSTNSKIRLLQAKIDTIIHNSGNFHADKKEAVENFVKTSQALASLQPEKNSGTIQHEYLVKNPHFNSIYQKIAQQVMSDSPSYVMQAGAPNGYNTLCRDDYDWCQEAHSLQVVEGDVQPFNNNTDVRTYLALPQTSLSRNVTQVSLWAQYTQTTNTTAAYLNKLPSLIGTDLPPSSAESCTQTVPLPQFENNYSLQAFLSHSTLSTCGGIRDFANDAVTNFNPNGPTPVGPNSNGGHRSSIWRTHIENAVVGVVISSVVIGAIWMCKRAGWLCFPPVTVEQRHAAFIKKFNKIINNMTKTNKYVSLKTSLLTNNALKAKYTEASNILTQMQELRDEPGTDSENKALISDSLKEARLALAKFERYKPADNTNESELTLNSSR